jgi:hypothetical protein
LLTATRNEMLTRVGPGTPMGDLLRRYWQPIAGASELDADPIKPVRLLGEDLVLYRDRGDRWFNRPCHFRVVGPDGKTYWRTTVRDLPLGMPWPS